jgi:hypothetical protein
VKWLCFLLGWQLMEIGANYKIGSKGFPNYTVPLTFWACDQDRAERCVAAAGARGVSATIASS